MDDHKVDHLFLIIGKNPLPNYVVARSDKLLRKEGKAYLVYTTDTKPYAYKLRDKLKLSNKELVSLGNYQSDAYEIQERIKAKAKDLEGRLGLNYTGGTKAMSVNAYLAIQSLRRSEDPVFSYLDSKKLELLIDRPDRKSIPVPFEIDISFEDIFDLHQLKLLNSPNNQAIVPELANSILLHNNTWRQWCEDVLHVEAKREKDNGRIDWKSKGELKKTFLSLEGLNLELIESLDRNECLDKQKQNIDVKGMLEKHAFSKPENVCKWLDGIWLEEYLLGQIGKHFQKPGMSFKVDINNGKDFEFDVAFIRGYQLFAFSCTSSSDRSLCKAKLFEAYVRGKQLGGDEARVALVCCSDDDTIQREMEVAISDRTIRVFRQSHLENIADEIIDWVDSLES